LIHTAEILVHTAEIFKILVQFTYYGMIVDVNVCDDTHHLIAIFKRGPRATNEVLAGDLVPAGTVLVTPVLHAFQFAYVNSLITLFMQSPRGAVISKFCSYLAC